MTMNIPDHPTDIDFINLNDIKTQPDTIPDGDYHLKIIEAELKQNKVKDGWYISYRAVVQAGEHAGYSVFSKWSLKDNASWRMKKDFKAMGYSPPKGIPHLAELFGFEGTAHVKIETSKDYPDKNSIERWHGPLT